MNNRGFAATGILYTILVLFILLIAGLLTMLYSRNNLLEVIKKHVKDDITNAVVMKMYTEPILNGADPVIDGDLVPVTIENNGTVRKANLTEEWYSYSNKKWANAVILIDKTINYANDAVIPEDNIQSYFVWVPRYKYKIFDVGNYTGVKNEEQPLSNAKSIDIVFESKNIKPSTGSTKGSYLTHPAFTDFESNGLWVGKFETTGSQSQMTIKPNNASLRNMNIKTMFELSYNYNRGLDSHMMKNTEWGATLYLAFSKYGIDGDINLNNNSAYLTGYSAVSGTDQSSAVGVFGTSSTVTQAYNTQTGYMASTTGNITGIYDMSGGAMEYVSAYNEGNYGSSGFDMDSISKYASKYFDTYSNPQEISFNYSLRILGDATGEMGPFYYYKDLKTGKSYTHNSWYGEPGFLVRPSYPWVARGGVFHQGILVGPIYFNAYLGDPAGYIGFRTVLIG